jgi:hypothetical protein
MHSFLRFLFYSGIAASLTKVEAISHPYAHFSKSPHGVLPQNPSRVVDFSSSSSRKISTCQPGQSCWPTDAQWKLFNMSLDGKLIAVQPPFARCFNYNGQPPDQTLCNAAVSNSSNSYFRSSLPGASQEPNWEQDPNSGADCFDAKKPCELGNIPPYAVAATTDSDVAKAVIFASSHNLQVVIKSTGHEYQGRSAGANSLLIWTHTLKGVKYNPTYQACPTTPSQPAVTTQPGVSWGEVYTLADSFKVEVVGGSEISVSSCGGYTMGGGHSWMGPAHGMAVDNVIQFKAVLANGTSVTVSACENSDLFWALRGGGGSSFAVVTECTYKAHPFSPNGATGFFGYVELLQGPTSLAVFLDGFFAYAFTLNNMTASAGGVIAGGYIIPDLSASIVEVVLGFNGTEEQAQTSINPIAQWIGSQSQYLAMAEAKFVPFDSLMAFHESFDNSSEPTGGPSTLGSRLIPAEIMSNDPVKRLALAINLTTITYTVGGLTGMFVAGGSVAANDPFSIETSISPAWRKAGFHVAFGAGWALNTSLSDQQGIFQGISALNDLLRVQTPDSGAYFSESDYLEPNWQDTFWGINYPRLQTIKMAYDPKGLFSCHHCVDLP